MSNAERELTDLKLEFVNFVKKICAILRFFDAVFYEKSRPVSMKFFIYACTGENQLFKKECQCIIYSQTN